MTEQRKESENTGENKAVRVSLPSVLEVQIQVDTDEFTFLYSSLHDDKHFISNHKHFISYHKHFISYHKHKEKEGNETFEAEGGK